MGYDAWADRIEIEHPGRPSAGIVRFAAQWVEPAVRVLHRPTLEGEENLPAEGGFVLVSNHPSGLGASEILCLVALYLRKLGPGRPLAGLAHPLAFRVPLLAAAYRRLGVVPSTHAHARRALTSGVPVYILPGGDHEGFRPVFLPTKVDFGGRVGFLRIARDARVPIVPMLFVGSKWSAPILLRSRALAWLLVVPRLTGVRRWGISVLGLVGAIAVWTLVPLGWPWRLVMMLVWLGSPLSMLPWVPRTVRIRIGPPLAASTLFPAGTGDEELRAALPVVEGAVQRLASLPDPGVRDTGAP